MKNSKSKRYLYSQFLHCKAIILILIYFYGLFFPEYGITAHTKMKFFIKDFISKCDQIHRFLRIWSHLLKKSLMKNFIFCAVNDL